MSATNRVRQQSRSAYVVQLAILLFVGAISVFPVGAGLLGAAATAATGERSLAAFQLVMAFSFPTCALAGWAGGVGIGLAATAVIKRRVRTAAAPDAVAWSMASVQDGRRWISGVLWAAPDGVYFRSGDQTRRWAADGLHDPEIVRDWLRPGLRWRTPEGEVRAAVVDQAGWHAVVRGLAA